MTERAAAARVRGIPATALRQAIRLGNHRADSLKHPRLHLLDGVMAVAAEIQFLLRSKVGGIKDQGLAVFPGPHRRDVLCPRPMTSFTTISGNEVFQIKMFADRRPGTMAA